MKTEHGPGSDKGAEHAGIVERNIRELYEHREDHRRSLTSYERAANRIAMYCGSAQFVIVNAAFFVLWIVLNVGWLGIKPFDPYPFGLLTTMVSLEAIFLSLFVLLSQNRMQKLSDRQSELDLQVNLLTEHELTDVLRTVDAIAAKLRVKLPDDPDKQEMSSTTDANQMLAEIERQHGEDYKDSDEKRSE
jgi:uncharacterized membrane protein